MPKKKQPKNAFYFYMLDFKDDLEAKGENVRGGMKEVADLAGPVWAVLPQRERIPYETLAKEHKRKDKHNLENKFTTMGISYAQLQAEERERRLIEMKMKNEILGTIQHLDRDSTLKTHVFYFIHFNYYCRVEDGSYLVCEVAIAQFNLEYGVKDVYHSFIRHDKIPTGYSFEAKSTSEDTHQIPLPHDLTEGEHWKHGNLFYSIKSILEQHKFNKELPPLYTLHGHIEVAQSALTSLAECHYPQNPDIFRVYPLAKLFFHLRNAAAIPGAQGFPTESLAERELDKDQYNFAPGIACSMHENCDTCVYCSKSIVTRWAFLICDHCCKDLRIPMIRGKHVPINAEIGQLPESEKNEGFGFLARGGTNGVSTSSTATASSSSMPPPKQEPNQAPLRVTDFSKTGPPEDSAHHFNLNAASNHMSASSSHMAASSNHMAASSSHVAASSSHMAASSSHMVASSSHTSASSSHTSAPSSHTSAPSTSSGNCWGVKPDVAPLRHPTTLPSSVQNALRFTEEDFPSLSGPSNVETPAAVAGRGRGRARILQEERQPGGATSSEGEGDNARVIGRGRLRTDTKPGSRLAANIQGLQFN